VVSHGVDRPVVGRIENLATEVMTAGLGRRGGPSKLFALSRSGSRSRLSETALSATMMARSRHRDGTDLGAKHEPHRLENAGGDRQSEEL
jgi:hypothetical protein